MERWRQLERHEIEAFLTLAEELHFGRTAERLQLTGPRITQTIQKVERHIGTALFDRSTRQVSLTPVGRQLRDDLIPHYRGIQEAVAKAISAGRGFRGLLSVGLTGPMTGVFAEAVDVFRGLHPDCEVQIREIQLSDPYGPLRRGEVDIEITEFPIDEPELPQGTQYHARPETCLPFHDGPPVSYCLVWRGACETSRVRAFIQVALGYLNTRKSSPEYSNGPIGSPRRGETPLAT